MTDAEAKRVTSWLHCRDCRHLDLRTDYCSQLSTRTGPDYSACYRHDLPSGLTSALDRTWQYLRVRLQHGPSPALAEVARGAGLNSPAAARYHVLKLATLGLITYEPGNIRLVTE